MSIRKKAFNAWAPREGQVWTKFAKPAMFVHVTSPKFRPTLNEIEIPHAFQRLDDGKTAIIADLPSIEGVAAGIGLARLGFRPVPLYNGIHEVNNGGLPNAVDNRDIIAALSDGIAILENTHLRQTAPPVFLLDSNRDFPSLASKNAFDNRWNIDFDDFPSADYMREQGITKIAVWANGEIHNDLRAILGGYQDDGIEIAVYADGQLQPAQIDTPANKMPQARRVSSDKKDAVRTFEGARFAFLLVGIMAAVNLFWMFFVRYQPLLWTAPTIMWLTYLWVPEIAGDIIAVVLTVAYFTFYITSAKKQSLLLIACGLFTIDVVVLFIYAAWYGIAAYTGYSFFYGLIAFVPPVIMLVIIIRGALVSKRVEKFSYHAYSSALDFIDFNPKISQDEVLLGQPRRVFRPLRTRRFRGFGGYGGTGSGGYGGSGGGYGGYGGGFGG